MPWTVVRREQRRVEDDLDEDRVDHAGAGGDDHQEGDRRHPDPVRLEQAGRLAERAAGSETRPDGLSRLPPMKPPPCITAAALLGIARVKGGHCFDCTKVKSFSRFGGGRVTRSRIKAPRGLCRSGRWVLCSRLLSGGERRSAGGQAATLGCSGRVSHSCDCGFRDNHNTECCGGRGAADHGTCGVLHTAPHCGASLRLGVRERRLQRRSGDAV